MTGRLDCLSHVQHMIECPIRLPKGKQIVPTKEEKVVLSDKLKLTYVLYVPTLQCNLTFVSQFINESNCVFSLLINFLLYRTTFREWWLVRVNYKKGFTTYEEGKLWQWCKLVIRDLSICGKKQLGHPSSTVLEFVPNASIGNISNQVCDACLRAKQTKDKFLASDNKALESFS